MNFHKYLSFLTHQINKIIINKYKITKKLKNKIDININILFKEIITYDFKSKLSTILTFSTPKYLKTFLWCPRFVSDIKELLDLIQSPVCSDKDHKFSRKTLWFFTPNKVIFFIGTSTILSATIYLTLLKQNIEKNPGERQSKPDFSLVTYNCNGLGDKTKLRKLLPKLAEIVDKGGIVFLQETHLVDTSYLNLLWKHKFISNCVKTNSAGVIILFNQQYNPIETILDNKGRSIVTIIESGEANLILSNSYFHNDHGLGVQFAEEMFTNLLKLQSKYPNHVTISAGDYNTCIDANDALNRNRSQKELILTEVIKNNNKITKLKDAYRIINEDEGFTWKRGKIYSRLDYIFISDE